MIKIIFKENENGTASYLRHEGELDFELRETVLNENSYMDDMIIYLFVDVFVDKWDVESAFEKLDYYEYETWWFEERLRRRGISWELEEKDASSN